MEINEISELLREGVWVVLKIAGPMLILSMVVGVVLSVFQAVTQVHEQTLAFVFKLGVVLSTLFFAGDWMLQTLVEYTHRVFMYMRG